MGNKFGGKSYKSKYIMKKFIFMLAVMLFTLNGFSQDGKNVTQKQRKEYMMKTFKIHSKKAIAYEKIRLELINENEKLKEQKLSSSQFRNKQKKLYKKYGDKISQIFSKGRFRSWSIFTQELEIYHMLCDEKLVSRPQMKALQKLESETETQRLTLWNKNIEESEKFNQKDQMIENYRKKIYEILGKETGEWFINYKQMYFFSLYNMDKYKTCFKDAYTIAEIEKEFRGKRTSILKSKMKNAQKEEEFIRLEEEKTNKILASIPGDVANRWKKINSKTLDYVMINKYGLQQNQLTKFKNAYNGYAISSYKILSNKKLPDSDKYTQLKKLSEQFVKKVSPLFSEANLKKWKGWWEYDFQRRMKRKGFVNTQN